MEEQVELLRRLWAEPVVDFRGKFHTIPLAGLNPLPGRRIPIWMGGTAVAAKLRMARIADGWMMNTGTEPDPLTALAQVREMVAEAGREPNDFGTEVRFGIREGLEPAAEELAEWHELGISHATVNPMGAGLEWPKGHIDALERLTRLYREA